MSYLLGKPKEKYISASIQLLDARIEVSSGWFLEFGEINISSDQSVIGSLKAEGIKGIIHFHGNQKSYTLTLQAHVSDESMKI